MSRMERIRVKPAFESGPLTIYQGDVIDVLRFLPDKYVHCCVTSPPYWGLRDYGTAKWVGGDPACTHQSTHGNQGPTGQRADRSFTGAQGFYKQECLKCGAVREDLQIGLERTPEAYVARIVEVFRDVRRVLRDDGTLWLNLGDSYTSGGRDYRDPGKSEYNGGKDGAYKNLDVRGTRPDVPAGLKPKDLVGIPWMVAFALRADGWYLRQDIIWAKPNPMPESVRDRCTKAHEYIFLLSKSERYYWNQEAILEQSSAVDEMRWAGSGNGLHSGEDHLGQGTTRRFRKSGNLERKPGSARGCPEGTGSNVAGSVSWEGEKRNKRSGWEVGTEPFPEAHFATFPTELIKPCILAGSPPGGIVLEPFCGSGTTLQVAESLNCRSIGIELNPEYIEIARRRLRQAHLGFTEAGAE